MPVKVNEALKSALAHAQDDPEGALEILGAALNDCREEADFGGVSTLARHAGAIRTQLGDLDGAIASYHEAMQGAPNDPLLLLAIGDLHRRLGRRQQADEAFLRCLELARASSDREVIDMAKAARAKL